MQEVRGSRRLRFPCDSIPLGNSLPDLGESGCVYGKVEHVLEVLGCGEMRSSAECCWSMRCSDWEAEYASCEGFEDGLEEGRGRCGKH